MLAAKAGGSGELLAKLLDAYAAEPGAIAVDLLLCEAHTRQPLLDGRADVAILPTSHPLAGAPTAPTFPAPAWKCTT